MLPLTLLKAATGSPILVELKDGDTYNGRLQSCDAWMNMNLTSDVICTSASGDTFTKLPQGIYIRGSSIKYLRLPPAVLEQAAQLDAAQPTNERGGRQSGRGTGGRMQSSRGGAGRDGRGRGRGRGPARGRSEEAGRGGRGGRGRGGGGRVSESGRSLAST